MRDFFCKRCKRYFVSKNWQKSYPVDLALCGSCGLMCGAIRKGAKKQ